MDESSNSCRSTRQACQASASRLWVQSLHQLFVIAPYGRNLGGKFISFPVLLQGGLKLAFLLKGRAEDVVCHRVISLQSDCHATLGNRAVPVPFVAQRKAQVEVRIRIIGLQSDGLPLFRDLTIQVRFKAESCAEDDMTMRIVRL